MFCIAYCNYLQQMSVLVTKHGCQLLGNRSRGLKLWDMGFDISFDITNHRHYFI